MRKIISILYIILYLSFTQPLINSKMSVKANPEVIHVFPTGNSPIQDAINSATSGTTIFVHNGVYVENVVINKSIALIGEDVDLTIIDGNRTENVISILYDDVTIKDFTIMNSRISPPSSGILVDFGLRNAIITNNKITSNYDGISLYSSTNTEISNNTFLNNNYGTSLYSSSNNEISYNTFIENTYGTGLYSSSNNEIVGNMLIENIYGISFYSSTNNEVVGNTLINNTYGMQLVLYSSDNVVYNNNFDNEHQAESDSINFWDYSDEGNFWSDYTGHDLNNDGIGDTPYNVAQSNQDNHPLMGMFSIFKVTLGKEQYNITLICNSTVSNFKFEVGTETGNKIIHFNVAGEESTVSFCRVRISTELMNYSLIVLVGDEEIIPTTLDISNVSYVYLYFTYAHNNSTITIISSKTLQLYNQLLEQYLKLQMDLQNLNMSYNDLLEYFSIILANYTALQEYQNELNSSYQKHLLDYSENVNILRNLVYVFAATTAILIITTIYLSKSAHASARTKREKES